MIWVHNLRFANHWLCDLGKFLTSETVSPFVRMGLLGPAMSEEQTKPVGLCLDFS